MYSEPVQLRVLDETLVLTEAEKEAPAPTLGVLMRGDSVIVIGERRSTWEYELDPHDMFYVVYFDRRKAYVPRRSLATLKRYLTMYGPGRRLDTTRFRYSPGPGTIGEQPDTLWPDFEEDEYAED
jgi:hypothetical protein